MKIYDHLIIGSGISGTYLSYRLNQKYSSQQILQIDKLSDFGGLLISSKVPNEDVYIDLGGVRYFPSIHPRVAHLVKKFHLKTEVYAPNTKDQIFNLRDKKFDSQDVVPDSESVYNIRNDEKGQNPFDTLYDNLTKYIHHPETIYSLPTRIKLFSNAYLSNHSFQSLSQQKLSQENWNRINDIVGHASVLSSKLSFVVGAVESLSLTNKDKTQYHIKHGYQTLPQAIGKHAYRIDFNDIEKTNYNWNVVFNVVVLKFKEINSNLWKIKIGKIKKITSPEDVDYKIIEKKIVYAKNIYTTIPAKFLNDIYDWKSEFRSILKYRYLNVIASRIFLKFESDWLFENGIGLGISVTTQPLGQVVHYAKNVVMIYNFQEQANYLYSFCPKNKQIQKDMIKPNDQNLRLIEETIRLLAISFQITTISPVEYIAWAFWANPLNFPSADNQRDIDFESSGSIINKLMFPKGINGNLHCFDNGCSYNSGWVEGSLELIDIFMDTKFKKEKRN